MMHCINEVLNYSTGMWQFIPFFYNGGRHSRDHMVVGFITTNVPMQSVPITTKVVSSTPVQVRCTRYNIM